MERIIYERDDLVSAKVRETEPQREIVYMDETWLNEGHRLQKEWVDLVTLNKANRKLLYNEGLNGWMHKNPSWKRKTPHYY